jgi:DNA-binding SARP family transcriptional activator
VYVQRLLQRLKRLGGPVVQLWGWPGSGRGLVLRAALEQEGRAIPAALLADPRRLVVEQRQGAQAGVRWLVAASPPSGVPAAADLLLTPPVLVPVVHRPPGVVGAPFIPPEEFLLTMREAAALWRAELGAWGEEPDTVARWADGWLQPLQRAAAAMRRGVPAPTSAAALASLPEVSRFLRREVVDPLPVTLVERLRQLASGEAAEPREPLAREWGLLLETHGGGLRLPSVLAEWLAQDRSPLRTPTGSRPAARRVSSAGDDVRFQLELFGTPVVLRRTAAGELEEVGWPLKRAFKILAFLASCPDRRATKAELVEALWPEEDRATIHRNFHPTLSYLRRSLGSKAGDAQQPLVFRNDVYQLNPELEWRIDAESFEEEVKMGAASMEHGETEAAVAVWRRAWSRYKGPFLAGFYDPWLIPRREAYHRQYLNTLRELGNALASLERTAEALDAYRAVLVEDALEEAVQVEVMRLYADQGRRDLVRRQYDRLCTLLRSELGVEPLPRTTEQYHQLMA